MNMNKKSIQVTSLFIHHPFEPLHQKFLGIFEFVSVFYGPYTDGLIYSGGGGFTGSTFCVIITNSDIIMLQEGMRERQHSPRA